jgi:hypothetical protein
MSMFEKPRILSDSEANTIRGKMLVGRATINEQFQLLGHMDLVEMGLRSALEKLSGCLPPRIYIYGPSGEYWSEQEPDPHAVPEYDEVVFSEVLDNAS